jgi:hypothetical protein
VTESAFDPQAFASYALSQLLFKDSSVEVGVRSVLRIANYKGLTWWTLWASLQLREFSPETLRADIQAFQDDFPEEKEAHRDKIVHDQLAEYLDLRHVRDNLARPFDLASLEKLTEIAQANAASGNEQQQSFVIELSTILSRIKSRVQTFLIAIERNEAPTPPKNKPKG